jgi:hypothetical protein
VESFFLTACVIAIVLLSVHVTYTSARITLLTHRCKQMNENHTKHLDLSRIGSEQMLKMVHDIQALKATSQAHATAFNVIVENMQLTATQLQAMSPILQKIQTYLVEHGVDEGRIN